MELTIVSFGPANRLMLPYPLSSAVVSAAENGDKPETIASEIVLMTKFE
jgi:hypothetical protein